MYFEYSKHFLDNKKYRSEITEEIIEYCITNSQKIRDRHWEDLLNAIYKIPPSNRILKVVYKIKWQTIKILTAYWLD